MNISYIKLEHKGVQKKQKKHKIIIHPPQGSVNTHWYAKYDFVRHGTLILVKDAGLVQEDEIAKLSIVRTVADRQPTCTFINCILQSFHHITPNTVELSHIPISHWVDQ